MAGSSVRDRSKIVAVPTPRGGVQVARQEKRGLDQSLGWRMFWFAQRVGQRNWQEATTPEEAIRRAVLLPPRKPPRWLAEVAATAERLITAES